jgi:hypothetical protein
MSTVITLQISSIKGFPNDLLKKNRGGTLSLVADIGGRLQECGKTSLQDEVNHSYYVIYLFSHRNNLYYILFYRAQYLFEMV